MRRCANQKPHPISAVNSWYSLSIVPLMRTIAASNGVQRVFLELSSGIDADPNHTRKEFVL